MAPDHPDVVRPSDCALELTSLIALGFNALDFVALDMGRRAANVL